jgi:hypothetical protein
MCGGGGGGYSARDSARDREQARIEAENQRIAAENQAQVEANASVAAKRVRARANTLMTRGSRMSQPATGTSASPAAAGLTSTVMARGAATLGGQ